jgi:hypothetical protein
MYSPGAPRPTDSDAALKADVFGRGRAVYASTGKLHRLSPRCEEHRLAANERCRARLRLKPAHCRRARQPRRN